ncbi:MAG: hypothetical protein HQL67_05330 [Magnetococcales bacterium]|nr:hypothetical protein [Magnetococcales bacterium]
MKWNRVIGQTALFWVVLMGLTAPSLAHHVLGRPAYSLNEDSNTPPALQVESQLGDYFITMMIFPAFPKPGVPARVNLYATHLDSGLPYLGEVTFTIRDDVLYGKTHSDHLGQQKPDDNIFRQGFVVPSDGSYIITATFDADNAPYIIDFPIIIGDVSQADPILYSSGILLLIVGGLALRRKRRRQQILNSSEKP